MCMATANYRPAETSTALVRRVEETGKDLVRLDDQEKALCHQELAYHSTDLQAGAVKRTLMSAAACTSIGLYNWARTSDPVIADMAVLVGSMVAVAYASSGALYMITTLEECEKVDNAIQAVKEKLTERFTEAQQEQYQEEKRHLLHEADHELQVGELLPMHKLARLVHLEAQDLQMASDQLAITVLQARKMLAYTACQEKRADGSPVIPVASTAAAFNFDLRRKEHSSILRQYLEGGDRALAEIEDYTHWPVPDFAKLDELAEQVKIKIRPQGKWAIAGRLLAPLLFTASDAASVWKLKKMFRDAAASDQGVEAPSLLPVADFEERLAAYEQAEKPLDLPAVRGFASPQPRKTLPKPLRQPGAGR